MLAPAFLIKLTTMNEEEEKKKRASDVLSEKAIWLNIGWLWFLLRPLTLGQIYEMGAIAVSIDADDIDMNRRVNVLAEMINHYEDADRMRRAAVVMLFRSRIMRWLFGWYVRRRITVAVFQKIISYTARTFDVNFFLTSIIFLRRITIMTEPKPTTAHGQSSEE